MRVTKREVLKRRESNSIPRVTELRQLIEYKKSRTVMQTYSVPMDEITTIFNHRYKDKYHDLHYKLIDDYSGESFNISGYKAIIRNKVLHLLAYFIKYPQQYNHSFERFHRGWIYSILFSMRHHVFRHYHTCDPYTYWARRKLYRFPVCLSQDNTLDLATKLYDLMYDRALALSKQF